MILTAVGYASRCDATMTLFSPPRCLVACNYSDKPSIKSDMGNTSALFCRTVCHVCMEQWECLHFTTHIVRSRWLSVTDSTSSGR